MCTCYFPAPLSIKTAVAKLNSMFDAFHDGPCMPATACHKFSCGHMASCACMHSSHPLKPAMIVLDLLLKLMNHKLYSACVTRQLCAGGGKPMPSAIKRWMHSWHITLQHSLKSCTGRPTVIINMKEVTRDSYEATGHLYTLLTRAGVRGLHRPSKEEVDRKVTCAPASPHSCSTNLLRQPVAKLNR